MLKNAREGIEPDQPGVGPISKSKLCNRKVSRWRTSVTLWVRVLRRKSATNSVLWFMGLVIFHMCRTNAAVVCASAVDLTDFFNTMEDAGAPPIEVDVSNLNMGDVIDVYP